MSRQASAGLAWLTAVAVVAVLLWPAPAAAVYQCDGQTDDCQCNMSNPYPCCDNGGGAFGNCTWWAWNEACCNWAYGLPGWGNAKTWASEATLNPDFQVLSNPVVGSIACRDQGTYGHVAWVTAVNGSNITVTEMNCCPGCNNGMRSWSYSASYFTGGFIVRTNQCECSPGDSQNQGCGNCGQQSRGCGNDCKWGGWGGCSGEGACADGDSQSEACGDCGQHSRSCDSSCSWGGWGACDGADPGGGTQACDTGQPGVCAAGIERCIDGNLSCEPQVGGTAEQCDGADNDCDGLTDEDDVCGSSTSTSTSTSGGGASPPVGGGQPAGGGGLGVTGGGVPAPNAGLVGGCDCRLPAAPSRPGGGALWLVALGGLAWARRRCPPRARIA